MQEIPTKRHGVLRSEHCMDPTCRGQQRSTFRPQQRLFYADLIPFHKPYHNSYTFIFLMMSLFICHMPITSFKHQLKPQTFQQSFFVKTAAKHSVHTIHISNQCVIHTNKYTSAKAKYSVISHPHLSQFYLSIWLDVYWPSCADMLLNKRGISASSYVTFCSRRETHKLAFTLLEHTFCDNESFPLEGLRLLPPHWLETIYRTLNVF